MALEEGMITIVSGFGRCGSTLVMQMLAAGGMPMSGEYPAFEDDAGGLLLTDSLTLAVMQKLDGKAVKFLDPHRGTIPRGPDYRVIWCSRDYHEQALSQAKFSEMMLGIRFDDIDRLEQSYRDDKLAAIKSLIACGVSGILDLRFENVLADPRGAAAEIAGYCGPGLDVSLMAAVARPRSPLCAPDMAIELSLMTGGTQL